MTTGNEIRVQPKSTARTSEAANPVFARLNGLLRAAWRAYAQHQTHAALIESWGLQGLANAMRIRTADEPVTINALLNGLCDLGGIPSFTIEVPNIGATLREVFDKDMALQSHTRPKLNAAAEARAAAHDATTGNLIEQILVSKLQRHSPAHGLKKSRSVEKTDFFDGIGPESDIPRCRQRHQLVKGEFR